MILGLETEQRTVVKIRGGPCLKLDHRRRLKKNIVRLVITEKNNYKLSNNAVYYFVGIIINKIIIQVLKSFRSSFLYSK